MKTDPAEISVEEILLAAGVDDPETAKMIESMVEEVEAGQELLKLCIGECGNKILIFGNEEGALCLECKAKKLKHDQGIKQ